GSTKNGSKSVQRRIGRRKRWLSSTAAERPAGVLCQIEQKRLTLPRIAAPGRGPGAGQARQTFEAAQRLRRPKGGPIFQKPIRPRDRTGAAIWKALLGTLRG